MRTTAKADYAVRAAVELAAAGDMVTADQIAQALEIPVNFLENILRDLRRAGIVESRRGQAGGYLLARPAEEISIADVIRAVEGARSRTSGASRPMRSNTRVRPRSCGTSGSRCGRAYARCSSRSPSPTWRPASCRLSSPS